MCRLGLHRVIGPDQRNHLAERGIKAVGSLTDYTEENGALGRSGLLVHPYMLGPNGDSNGCVSIKNYDKFLKAFSNGEVKRMVVVPRLGDEKLASRQAT